MSGHEHVSQDVLLDALYGLTEIGTEIEECPYCAAQWAEMKQQRARFAESPDVSNDLLAAQRREIYARLSAPEASVWAPRWAQALAIACLLTLGVFWFRAQQPTAPPAATTELSDAQLFADVSEIYSLEQSFEPAAAAPIHALFEEEN